MKRLITFLSVIIICASSYAQIKGDDYKGMIDSAVIIQTAAIHGTAYKSPIYLIDSRDHGYMLASFRDQKKFHQINIYDRKRRKILRKGVHAWKILPTLNNDVLVVEIVDFMITYKRNNYNFANGGGATVVFEYSCDNRKWMLKESKWSGI